MHGTSQKWSVTIFYLMGNVHTHLVEQYILQWIIKKGVSSLSDLCLTGNMDDLLDDTTGLVSTCLLHEPDDSPDDVSNESSEDEDSDEIIIVFCAVRTSSSSIIVSIRTRSSSLIA